MSDDKDSRLNELIENAVGDNGSSIGDQIDIPYVDILAEYVEEIDAELVSQGWMLKNAKSAGYPFCKFDQSMVTHTRAGVFFLLRYIGEIVPDSRLIGRGERKTVLRELVALFVAHDFHKLHESDGYEDEFNLPKDLITDHIRTLGLGEFAPSLSMDDFHAVCVGLHRTSNGNHEMCTERFLELEPFLDLADAVAGTTHPEEFVSQGTQKRFETASASVTPHYHSVDGGGPVKSIINKAAAETFEELGYRLLTIHGDGCTYASKDTTDDAGVGTLPVDTATLTDALYENFLETLRDAMPRYRNRSVLSGTAEGVKGQGRYHISEFDVLCLPRRDLVRAIVEKGMTEADAPWELPGYATTALDALSEQTDVTFDRTFRIEGIARLVHTVRTEVVSHLVRDDASAPAWAQNEMAATLAVFGVSKRMQARIAAIYEQNGESLTPTGVDFPYKYLIAQDLLNGDEYFTGEHGGETIDRLTANLTDELADFEQWEQFRTDQVGHVDTELRSILFNRLRFDGEKLSSYGVPAAVESYVDKEKSRCGLCERATTAAGMKDPSLIEAPLQVAEENNNKRHITVENKGETVDLQETAYRESMCFACQIDIEMQAADTGWETEDTRLHLKLSPQYSYTPLSGIIFTHIVDTYSSNGTERTTEFADNVFMSQTDGDSSYQDWMSAHAQNAFGREMLSNIQQGFMLGPGYGGHTVSFPLPEGNTREGLFTGTFAACVAAACAGLNTYVSTEPVIRAPETERSLVTLSDSVSQLEGAFGGSSLMLAEMETTLNATSAIRRLGNAIGHTHAPVSAFTAYQRNSECPLVGSQMLLDAVGRGIEPTAYAEDAALLDRHAGRQARCTHQMATNAQDLSDRTRNQLQLSDDPALVRDVVDTLLTEIETHGRQLRQPELQDRLTQTLVDHEEVTPERAGASAREEIQGFTGWVVAVLFEQEWGGSTAVVESRHEPLCQGVWTKAVASIE
jgi:CRISPR type I-D-associated protein Csc3/Cas10d